MLKLILGTPEELAKFIALRMSDVEIVAYRTILDTRIPTSEFDCEGIMYWSNIMKMAQHIERNLAQHQAIDVLYRMHEIANRTPAHQIGDVVIDGFLE